MALNIQFSMHRNMAFNIEVSRFYELDTQRFGSGYCQFEWQTHSET